MKLHSQWHLPVVANKRTAHWHHKTPDVGINSAGDRTSLGCFSIHFQTQLSLSTPLSHYKVCVEDLVNEHLMHTIVSPDAWSLIGRSEPTSTEETTHKAGHGRHKAQITNHSHDWAYLHKHGSPPALLIFNESYNTHNPTLGSLKMISRIFTSHKHPTELNFTGSNLILQMHANSLGQYYTCSPFQFSMLLLQPT